MRHILLPLLLFLTSSVGACSSASDSELTTSEQLSRGRSDSGAIPPVELVEGETGILVVVPEGAFEGAWELWKDEKRIDDYEDTGVLFPAEPGVYTVKEYSNPQFIWASGVPVETGKTTRVQLGALEVVTPAGIVAENLDLWDETGDERLHTPYETDQVIPVPAGSYTVTKYFTQEFVWKSPVVVEAGHITPVEMGGVKLLSETISSFDLYDGSNDQKLSMANDSNKALPVPPGSYTLKEYFSQEVLASGVQVTAGTVTEVEP